VPLLLNEVELMETPVKLAVKSFKVLPLPLLLNEVELMETITLLSSHDFIWNKAASIK
jgi:hypothetical protein